MKRGIFGFLVGMLMCGAVFAGPGAYDPFTGQQVVEDVQDQKIMEGRLFRQVQTKQLLPAASSFILIDMTTVTKNAVMWLEFDTYPSTCSWVLYHTNFVIGAASSGTPATPAYMNRLFKIGAEVPVYLTPAVGSTSSILDYGDIYVGSTKKTNKYVLKAGEPLLLKVQNNRQSGGIGITYRMYWYER